MKLVLREIVVAAFVMAVATYAGVAHADPIGPSCGSCAGGIFTLEYSLVDSDTATIFYTADLRSSTRTSIDAIAFGAFTGSATLSGSLDVSPAGWGTDFQLTGLNSSGCNSSNANMICSQGPSGGLSAGDPGDLYSWTFTVNFTGGSLKTAAGEASIRADFSPNGVLSESITLQQRVPEPGTLLLLGAGLGGFGTWARWRRRKV